MRFFTILSAALIGLSAPAFAQGSAGEQPLTFGDDAGTVSMPCEAVDTRMREDVQMFSCIGSDAPSVFSWLPIAPEPVRGRPPGGESFAALVEAIQADDQTSSFVTQEIAGRPSFVSVGAASSGPAAMVAIDDGDHFIVIMAFTNPEAGVARDPISIAQSIAASVEFRSDDEASQ